MIIKVTLLTIVLLFLLFLPSLCTFLHYYKKNGGYNDEVASKTIRAFTLSVFIFFVIFILFGISYNIICEFY